ncbi:GNAT family N-acetyltransferase [Promicromonospora sp. NPDC057138]|uniref:GNAT family N-acetyltransferase n=1 Tax=Promicromonospora sp. NPDC057138 TaxID=3346031 RepID=UPI003643D82D
MSVIVSDPTWVATTWDDPRAVALREAMTSDLAPRYADLWEQRARLFAPAGPGELSTVPTAEEILVTWIALDGDQAVATGSLRRLGGTAAHPAVIHEVKRMFVRPTHRRRGLAAGVLAAVERSALDRGIDVLRLQTGIRQPEAVALYEREGWTRIDPYPPYPAESSICFEKRL